MQNDQRHEGHARLGHGEPRSDARRARAFGPAGTFGPFGRVVAAVAWGLLLLAAFMFSLMLFAVLALVGLLVGGWLWWKTRELRRQLRERPPGGHVIDGEVIRD